jgi:hypothetical protein
MATKHVRKTKAWTTHCGGRRFENKNGLLAAGRVSSRRTLWEQWSLEYTAGLSNSVWRNSGILRMACRP